MLSAGRPLSMCRCEIALWAMASSWQGDSPASAASALPHKKPPHSRRRRWRVALERAGGCERILIMVKLSLQMNGCGVTK